ncbi:MAG TPA: TCR/Tet family MFS transporter [Nevskia sp.]|nr:TCR/Tet family MFS transporter [Nevskia sp.]
MSEPQTPITGRRRQAAVAFIFVTIVLDVLGFGIIIPVLPKLVQQMMGGDPAQGARMYGVFVSVWALMQFFFSPLLGAISDRYGRRRVILISCFGLGMDYIVMALAPTVWWLLLGRIISGICASSFSTASAYIADVSPPEKRAAAFGMMGAAFGVGFVLGPGLGGLLGDIDPRLPFWGSAVLALLSATYGYFLLPESLPPGKRDSFAWSRANPVGSFNLLRSHPELLGLAGVQFLFQMAHYVLPSMYVLYTTYRYGWDAKTVGLTLAGVGVLSIIVQGGLVKPAIRALGERGALQLGLVFGIAGFTGFALAPTAFWMWAALPVFALWGLLGPGLQSLMSKRVAPYEQGKLQGANGSITSIAGLVAPALFTQSFAYFIDKSHAWTLPGAPFFLAAGLLLLALLLAVQVLRRAQPLPEPAT